MPHFSASPGDFVEMKIKGYVVYNAGGFIGITNDRDVYEQYKNESSVTFDREQGEFYFDIPNHMTESVEEAHPYPAGTLARIKHPNAWARVVQYSVDNPFKDGRGETHWLEANTGKPVFIEPDDEVEIIWNPEEQ
jgi:hypothetical protein